MKIVGLVNQTDRQIGYRLAGFDSRLVKSPEELIKELEDIDNKQDVGLIVINPVIYGWLEEEWKKRMSKQIPVIVVLEEN